MQLKQSDQEATNEFKREIIKSLNDTLRLIDHFFHEQRNTQNQ